MCLNRDKDCCLLDFLVEFHSLLLELFHFSCRVGVAWSYLFQVVNLQVRVPRLYIRERSYVSWGTFYMLQLDIRRQTILISLSASPVNSVSSPTTTRDNAAYHSCSDSQSPCDYTNVHPEREAALPWKRSKYERCKYSTEQEARGPWSAACASSHSCTFAEMCLDTKWVHCMP